MCISYMWNLYEIYVYIFLGFGGYYLCFGGILYVEYIYMYIEWMSYIYIYDIHSIYMCIYI